MVDVTAFEAALRTADCDGWLMYDFRGNNPLARRILDLPVQAMTSRRWAYCVRQGAPPRKLVHRIESNVLDHLPGEMRIYLSWQEWDAGVAWLLEGLRDVAMEYAPLASNPYISRVDAGTFELVRACNVRIASSGDLAQQFEAVWDEAQWASHQASSRLTQAAFENVWSFISEQIKTSGGVEESAVADLILQHFEDNGLITDHGPIVAVGANGGSPHYETGTGAKTRIQRGDVVLVDLWAKLNQPRAVFSDYTQVAVADAEVPPAYQKLFDIVAAARDAAIGKVESALAAGEDLRGWQVDQAAREVIEQAGYAAHFTHRTGHSIGEETHGNGAHMDNLESRETRRVLPRTCFSIEPGIYLPEFGIRSEVNVYVDANTSVHVTGKRQNTVTRILAEY